jgi:hypothetical protein
MKIYECMLLGYNWSLGGTRRRRFQVSGTAYSSK